MKVDELILNGVRWYFDK